MQPCCLVIEHYYSDPDKNPTVFGVGIANGQPIGLGVQLPHINTTNINSTSLSKWTWFNDFQRKVQLWLNTNLLQGGLNTYAILIRSLPELQDNIQTCINSQKYESETGLAVNVIFDEFMVKQVEHGLTIVDF